MGVSIKDPFENELSVAQRLRVLWLIYGSLAILLIFSFTILAIDLMLDGFVDTLPWILGIFGLLALGISGIGLRICWPLMRLRHNATYQTDTVKTRSEEKGVREKQEQEQKLKTSTQESSSTPVSTKSQKKKK